MYLKIDPQIHWDIRIFFGQKRVFQQPVRPLFYDKSGGGKYFLRFEVFPPDEKFRKWGGSG